MRYLLTIFTFFIVLSSCDASKMSETPDAQFLGVWKLTDRGILDGIEMEISKDEKGVFKGVITQLNDNKYVKMFMEKGDVLLSGIKRNSNFEFVVSEKKIASPLFSAYGQSTTSEFEATFEGENAILLGKNGQNGSYVRVKNR